MTLQYTCSLIISEKWNYSFYDILHQYFYTHHPINMCHDSIPHAESYQPNFGTLCIITSNHICSNAYSQPKREGFVDKWRMFTWHQA